MLFDMFLLYICVLVISVTNETNDNVTYFSNVNDRCVGEQWA